MLMMSEVALLVAALSLCAQDSWFQPSVLEKPDVRKALQSVDDRATEIVAEWIRLTETPAPTGKEQTRAKYIRSDGETPPERDPNRRYDQREWDSQRDGRGSDRGFCDPHGHRISRRH
jgi:hypothetical protein